jgi:dTDP-4-dehydrorhamnose reductase
MNIPHASRVPAHVELWAGPECTVARLGDSYVDQCRLSGHDERPGDIDAIARCGVRAIRYPVLWERTMPFAAKPPNWGFADERLVRIRALGMRPIVGLVHHGSGPKHTNLLDPQFPAKLAEYARLVSERYPWVDAFTPVNEPLTTARFSGLYGHWFPHKSDDASFVRCLFNECKAVALAMRAVRAVNPAAELVQTEDFGRIHSTPSLAYQADFENQRRWLSFDLLCGRVDSRHPLRRYLLWAGLAAAELDFFLDHPCPPSIIGLNHYVTSDRFLDEKVWRYPSYLHGGNGRQRYADVEALRVLEPDPDRFGRVVREVWGRYHLPIALTEVHISCTREEQMRWFHEAWESMKACRREGIDARAVAAWSFFGAFDWNSLLTRQAGFYEAGVYDVRGGSPRPTALVAFLRKLADGVEGPALQPDHAPVFEEVGWWRRPERRLFDGPHFDPSLLSRSLSGAPRAHGKGRPVLITGATGTLGSAFARVCYLRGLPYRVLTRGELDIASLERAREAIAAYRPWLVVNAAGYVRVDDAEAEEEECLRENAFAPGVLAEACAESRVRFLTFSSDLVFDGAKAVPYIEQDAPAPLSVYGRSKTLAEKRVLECHPAALVVRTSAFFGPWDEHNFLTAALRRLRSHGRLDAVDSHTVSPTYVPDLVHAALDIVLDGESGLLHLANAGALSWGEFARMGARMAGLPMDAVRTCEPTALGWRAARPLYSALASARGFALPALEEAVERYLREALRA